MDYVTKSDLIKYIPTHLNHELFKSYLECNDKDIDHFFLSLDYDRTLDMLIICDFLGGTHQKRVQKLIDHLTDLVST
jgi:hypothetical protein